MIQTILDTLMNEPITSENTVVLVVCAFVVMFGIEAIVELFVGILKGVRKI